MTLWRMYYEKRGMHVHCRLFCGAHDGALGQCGRLTFKVPEFRELYLHHKNYAQLVETLLSERLATDVILDILKANMSQVEFRRERTVDDKPAGDDDALAEIEVVENGDKPVAVYQSFDPPTEEWAKTVCKVGYGAECCRYLVRNVGSWSCEKNTDARAVLDGRVASGEIRARGDNCIGRGSTSGAKQ